MDGAEQAAGTGADAAIDLRAVPAGPALPSLRAEANRLTAEITALGLMVELVVEGRRRTQGNCARAGRRRTQRAGCAHSASRNA
jgi:hypothetical protein